MKLYRYEWITQHRRVGPLAYRVETARKVWCWEDWLARLRCIMRDV